VIRKELMGVIKRLKELVNNNLSGACNEKVFWNEWNNLAGEKLK